MYFITKTGKKLKDKRVIINKFEFSLDEFELATIKLIVSNNETPIIINKLGFDELLWKAHVDKICMKMGAVNRYELGLFALQKDFISPSDFTNSFRQKVRDYAHKYKDRNKPVYINYTDFKIIKALYYNDKSKIKEALKGFNNQITKSSYCNFLYNIFEVDDIHDILLLIQRNLFSAHEGGAEC